MKWYINLIALCAALATASPTPGKTIDFSDNGSKLARREQGDCPANDEKCCCRCAAAGNWPCVGCVTKVHFCTEAGPKEDIVFVTAFDGAGNHIPYPKLSWKE